MVNSHSDIASWVNNPSQLREQDALWLEQQVTLYPYCSTYRILLAKAHKNEDSFLQKKHLRMAALYTGDRERLFQFIEDVEVEEVEVEVEVEAEVEVEKIEVEVDNALGSLSEEGSEEEVEVEAEAEVEKIEVEAEQAVKESDKIDFDEIVTYNPLEELSVDEKEVEEEIPLPVDLVMYNPEVELLKLSEDEVEVEAEDETEEGDASDFMYWLNHIGEEKKPKKPTKKKIKETSKSPQQLDDLLTNFLANKRSQPKIKKEFYNAEKKAEESERDDSPVISETLIRIYEQQGYYQKAIEGYEKLSLQNPEKTAYFAARISELKDKQE